MKKGDIVEWIPVLPHPDSGQRAIVVRTQDEDEIEIYWDRDDPRYDYESDWDGKWDSKQFSVVMEEQIVYVLSRGNGNVLGVYSTRERERAELAQSRVEENNLDPKGGFEITETAVVT
jgi:hypothetical protein